MNEKLQMILIAAAEVVLTRRGDVQIENINAPLATVDISALLRLDNAIADCFELGAEGVTFENMDSLVAKIRCTQDVI